MRLIRIAILLIVLLIIVVVEPSSQKNTVVSEGEKMERQLCYANFTLASEFQESYKLSFSVSDNDAKIFIHMKIELCEGSDYKTIYTQRFLELQQSNEYVEEVKKKSFVSNGKRFNVRKINYKKYQEEDDDFRDFIEYVFIELADNIVVFSCYGFDKYYNNGVLLWEEMYRSFTEDHSKAYKLPFGSFTPSQGLEDFSSFYYEISGVQGYSIEIEYVDDIQDAKKKPKEMLSSIKEYYPNFSTRVKMDKKQNIDGKKSRYYEMHYKPTKEEDTTEVFALFQILDDLQPGLEITILADSLEVFDLYRPKMNDFLNSIQFEK